MSSRNAFSRIFPSGALNKVARHYAVLASNDGNGLANSRGRKRLLEERCWHQCAHAADPSDACVVPETTSTLSARDGIFAQDEIPAHAIDKRQALGALG